LLCGQLGVERTRLKQPGHDQSRLRRSIKIAQ
jgi:hypothetical protein